MAVIENLSLANTFGEWVNITNDVVSSVNDLYENNFTKTSGTLFLNDVTTGLSVSNNSLFNGLVEVSSSGSIVSYGLIEGKDSLVLSNTSSNKVVLTANGIVSLIGPNTTLQVSNNAVIYGTLNVDNEFANTITVTTLKNAYVNAAFSKANSAFTVASDALPKAGGLLTGDIWGANATFNNILANGNFTVTGTTVYNTDTFTLNAESLSNLDGYFSSYRPTGLANAYIRWSENTLSWDIRDVNNSDDSTAYANVVTSNLTSSTTRAGIVQLTDSTSSTSTTTAATPNSVKTTFDRVTSAYAFANTGYTQANNAASFANGAFTSANSAASFANSAYAFANTGYTQANNAASFANGAFGQANSAASFANGAFVTANSAASFANGSFDRANSAYNFANTLSSTSGAFDRANSAYDQANSAASFANGAFEQANSAASFANGAFARANSAFNRSNSSIFSITANTNGALLANGTQGVAQTGNVLISLANTAVTSGTYGGTTQIPVYTVDGSGRITYSANVLVATGATLTDDLSTNATRYPVYADATTGVFLTAYTSSNNYTYNPSTGTLGAIIFTSLSDRSVKDNIQVVSNALETIKQIEGVSFNWKQNGNKSYGVIAQDIEQVLPDVVQTNDEGLKTVDYQALSAFLIESIKQLSSEIEELKKQK